MDIVATIRRFRPVSLSRTWRYLLVPLLIWLPLPGAATAQTVPAPLPAVTGLLSSSTSVVPAAQLPWLEPNGLNVVDLVGFVPDEYLRGAVLVSYSGAVVYESGSRNGNQVTIRARIYPRIIVNHNPDFTMTLVNTLAQPSLFDEWESPTPPALFKLYKAGVDITSQLLLRQVAVAGQVWPVRNTSEPMMSRYQLLQTNLTFQQGWAVLPANRGLQLYVNTAADDLVGEFVFDVSPSIKATVLGTQKFSGHSYIGVGELGWLNPLMEQMRHRFGDRDDKFSLSVPAGADYIFVNFPPMQADPYSFYSGRMDWGMQNITRPSGGTYRLVNSSGQLSTDRVGAMGLPLGGQWLDADLSGGSAYLPYLQGVVKLGGPEYILPANVPYQTCMTSGNCPDTVLNQINVGTTPITVVYLKVERTSAVLVRVPLRQVGPGWQPGSTSATAAGVPVTGQAVFSHRVYLPTISSELPKIPPDDSTGCPCGWFDVYGRMLDFIPGG